jgi:hypothetical protein
VLDFAWRGVVWCGWLQRKQAATKAELTKEEPAPLKPWQRRMLEKQTEATPAPVNSGLKDGKRNPMIQQGLEKAKPTTSVRTVLFFFLMLPFSCFGLLLPAPVCCCCAFCWRGF